MEIAMDKAKKERILKAMEDYTKKATVSPETARATLVREGIYLEDGSLSPRYGGEPKAAP
jgi:hypothetical protein